MSLVLILHFSSHSFSLLPAVSFCSLNTLTSSLRPRASSSRSRSASERDSCLFCAAAWVRYSVDNSARRVVSCASRWARRGDGELITD